jgi:hypothetical protein
MCRTPHDIKQAVQEAALHELGHYFGLDDEQLDVLMEEYIGTQQASWLLGIREQRPR